MLSLLPLVALVTCVSSAQLGHAKDVNYWFSFGDSYTATWFDPYGELPTVGNPLGNPPYPGWTATGGEGWVDLVTTKYNNSLLLTYNFAYGGATINATLVPPYLPTVHSLIDQVNDYVATAAKKPATSPWTSKNALFSVWIGINDIGNSWYQEGDRDAFSDVLLDAYFGQIERLYQTGGRNFLFVAVPPIDRSPYMILNADEASRTTEGNIIKTFNKKLQAKIKGFEYSHKGVESWYYDSWADFTRILNNLAAYGFTTNETAYGSDPSNFWGNDYHPSSYAHEYFGETVGERVLSHTIW